MVLLELTVPWEERIEEAHERKLGKYQQITQQCQQVGMELASGSRLPRISWAVTLERPVQTWNKRSQQETVRGEYHKKSRDSISDARVNV